MKKNPIVTAIIGALPAIITALKRNKSKQAVPASAYSYTQDLPSWAKYLTIDSDGAVTAHEEMPETKQAENTPKYFYWVSAGRNEEVTASVIVPKVWRVKR